MSFLKSVLGGAEAAAAPAGAATVPQNPMANGLGRVFGTSGSHISDIASRIGTGANQIAVGGGAQPGYAGPAPGQIPQTSEAPQEMPNNHMQMLDQDVLRAIIQRFRPATGVQY